MTVPAHVRCLVALLLAIGLWLPAAAQDATPDASSELAQAVTDRLLRADLAESGVLMVHVEGDVVTLVGAVREPALIGTAEQLALETEGVGRVVNQLEVVSADEDQEEEVVSDFLPGGENAGNAARPQEQAEVEADTDADNDSGTEEPPAG